MKPVGDNRRAERPAARQKTAVVLQMALFSDRPHVEADFNMSTHTSQLALNTQEHSIIPPAFKYIVDCICVCVCVSK